MSEDLSVSPFHAELLQALYTTPAWAGRVPRLYKRDNSYESYVKQEFADITALRALHEEKLALPLYDAVEVPAGFKICLFTCMIGGWGDWVTSREVSKILTARFPPIEVQSVVCMPSSLSGAAFLEDPTLIPLFCDTPCPPSEFPAEVVQALRSADLILSLPTFYPYTQELKQEFSSAPLLCIGQYGFLESSWFHPQSGNLCMGLHALEMGILTRPPVVKEELSALENPALLKALFETTDKEEYTHSHRLYLAYLLSPVGGAIYLHALLYSQRHCHKTLDLCTPHLGWLIDYIQQQKAAGRPFLEGNHGIKTVEIHFEGSIDYLPLQEEGKRLRIICPGTLSEADFRQLMMLSEPFVAIRGDQSFSEAISAERAFFYDSAPWAKYFIKDLLKLAEDTLQNHPSTLTLFRCMHQAALYQIPEEVGEWVEETYFQEKRPWLEIAQEMAQALQDPAALQGYRAFCQLLQRDHSFNKNLCRIIQKTLKLR